MAYHKLKLIPNSKKKHPKRKLSLSKSKSQKKKKFQKSGGNLSGDDAQEGGVFGYLNDLYAKYYDYNEREYGINNKNIYIIVYKNLGNLILVFRNNENFWIFPELPNTTSLKELKLISETDDQNIINLLDIGNYSLSPEMTIIQSKINDHLRNIQKQNIQVLYTEFIPQYLDITEILKLNR